MNYGYYGDSAYFAYLVYPDCLVHYVNVACWAYYVYPYCLVYFVYPAYDVY